MRLQFVAGLGESHIARGETLPHLFVNFSELIQIVFEERDLLSLRR